MNLIKRIRIAVISCLGVILLPGEVALARNLSSEDLTELTNAHSALTSGQNDLALELLEPLYEKYPSNTSIANNFAVALFNDGQHTEAGLVLQQFLVSSEEVSTISNNLFSVYDFMAAQSYEMLTGNTPEQPTLTYMMPEAGADTLSDDALAPTEIVEPIESVKLRAEEGQHEAANEISRRLEGYISAWSGGDIDSYLGFYYPNRSPLRGTGFSTWEKDRRAKVFPERKISIAVDDLQIMKIDSSQAIAVFRQTYQARNYSDVTTKQLTWLKQDGEWFIRYEMSLPH